LRGLGRIRSQQEVVGLAVIGHQRPALAARLVGRRCWRDPERRIFVLPDQADVDLGADPKARQQVPEKAGLGHRRRRRQANLGRLHWQRPGKRQDQAEAKPCELPHRHRQSSLRAPTLGPG
jgi:hypothetical protein